MPGTVTHTRARKIIVDSAPLMFFILLVFQHHLMIEEKGDKRHLPRSTVVLIVQTAAEECGLDTMRI